MEEDKLIRKPLESLHPYGEFQEWVASSQKAVEFLTLVDEDLVVHYNNQRHEGIPDPRGLSCLTWVSEDSHALFRNAAVAAVETGLPQPFETRADGPNGETSYYSCWAVQMQVPGGPQHLAIIGTDITHLRRIEERLSVSDATLRSLVRDAPDFICVVDREHRIEFLNRVVNYQHAEVLGQTVESFLPESEFEKVHSAIELVFSTGEHQSYETFARMPKGDDLVEVLYSTRLGPIYRDGKVERVTLISTDITERVAAEAALKASEEKLRQSQKMQALGQLTGGIAHDFNNLLTVIMGNLNLAQLGEGSVEQSLEMAVEAVEKASALTQRLLSFGRREKLTPVDIDLMSFLASFVDVLRRTLGEQVNICLQGSPDTWHCSVDRSQLENAVLNLAINARDAMGFEGGELTIGCGNEVLAEDQARRLGLRPGEYVLLTVSDTGPGISGEVMERVFEPFFTTKPAGEGSGLGLSMVEGFAKQSQGSVSLDSSPGEGLRVALYLPRSESCEKSIETESATPPLERARRQLILVVEDQSQVAKVAVRLLEGLGFRTIRADRASRALELLEQYPETELLFTDVGLPGGMNGLQLADVVERRWPRLKILFTSGYDAELTSHLFGASAHILKKPYNRAQLAKALDEVQARRPEQVT